MMNWWWCAECRPSCGNVSWRAPRTAYVISMCTAELLTLLELTLLSWLVVFAQLPPDVASCVTRCFMGYLAPSWDNVIVAVFRLFYNSVCEWNYAEIMDALS